MNKIFTFLFILTSSFCYSQNWSPINLNEKYNYQIDTASYLSNTIWIDSIKAINPDSIFFFNKIVQDCLECPWLYEPFIEFKMTNQTQFLQDKMIKKNDNCYVFEGNRKFAILTHANLNDNWIFDTTNNVTATVINLYENEIFGIMDSLKVIHLSNNDTIWLSKNHGIFKFQENEYTYELKGVEGRDIGQVIPNFWDFYNFDIGDVFQYELRRFNSSSSSSPMQWNTTLKYEILSKEVDSTKYTYSIFQIATTYQNTSLGWILTGSGESVDTIVFEAPEINFYTELYNRTLVEYDEYELCEGRIKNFIGIYIDPIDQRIVKKTGNPFPEDNFNSVSYQFQDFDYQNQIALSDTLVPETCAASFHYEFKEGVGLVARSIYDFEQGNDTRLVGYVKGTDTIGIISPDEEILVNTREITEELNLVNIFPNPSANGNFEIAFNSTESVQIDIFNISGKKVYSLPKTSINNHFIDLSKHPNGIYILQLSNNNLLKSYKLVKI